MQNQHLEVIPRIIDASLAANYQKTEPLATNPEPVKHAAPQSIKNAAPQSKQGDTSELAGVFATACVPTFTQRFFTTLKDYMIPILFVIVVIVCIYVIWKYFTKYRKASEEVIVEPTIVEEIEKPDLSKYVFDADSSDEEEEEDVDSKLSVIEEESEEDGETDEGSEADEGDTDEESEDGETDEEGSDEESEVEESEDESMPSLITEPDIDAITNLINQSIVQSNDRTPIDTFLLDEGPERFEYISPTPDASDNESEHSAVETQVDETDIFNLSPEETKPKVRKARKSKRVVL